VLSFIFLIDKLLFRQHGTILDDEFEQIYFISMEKKVNSRRRENTVVLSYIHQTDVVYHSIFPLINNVWRQSRKGRKKIILVQYVKDEDGRVYFIFSFSVFRLNILTNDRIFNFISRFSFLFFDYLDVDRYDSNRKS
jgi:hypothetical protein